MPISTLLCLFAIGSVQDIKVRISIPTLNFNQADKHRMLKMGQPFHIVFENVSRNPLLVYREHSSWSDESLILEFRAGTKTWRAVRMVDYNRNAPLVCLLQPDDIYVRTVRFEPPRKGRTEPDWKGLPPPGEYQLRAIYKVAPLGGHWKESHRLLWTGEVASLPVEIRFVEPGE